jgi:hypothetical protein
MAKRSFQNPTWTPTATADGNALANGTFMSIGASSATHGVNVLEIYIGGQASASSVNIMMFARDSTLGGSLTALAAPVSDGPLDSRTATTSLALIATAAGTSPQRSATTTSSRLNLSLNAFGGIVRWVAAPGEEWGITGVTVSISESSLSAFTGGSVGLIGAHIIYEPLVLLLAAMGGLYTLLGALSGSGLA